MKKFMILAGAMALAACGGSDQADADQAVPAQTGASMASDGISADADAGFESVAPGNYEVVRADGSIDNLTILPGMMWATVFANGEAVGGTIFAQGGKNCFVTEGVEEQSCFQGSEPAEDGSMEVTAEDGEIMTVRPVNGV